MNLRFVDPALRHSARRELDGVLSHGTDQLAVACAFMTKGGAEVLKAHAASLQRADSYLVVAWEDPTDPQAVESLHDLAPGHVYVHLGAETPVEKGVGRGLMHSKLFLARDGDRCWLWVGSHNLTASAMLGINAEAAVVLEGDASEQPFVDALAHLSACRQEAIVFNPFTPPPKARVEPTLVIHAECSVALQPPTWFVHLRLSSTRYDRFLSPGGKVWLYLHAPGSLTPGRPRPTALAAYSGTLTAFNYSDSHPEQGIPADWTLANYVLEDSRGVFHMQGTGSSPAAPTQGLFRVDAEENRATIWLSDSPQPKLEMLGGDIWFDELDPSFREFFTRSSVRSGKLRHRWHNQLSAQYRLSQKETGDLEPSRIEMLLGTGDDSTVVLEQAPAVDEFPFIYRAKYRVGGR